MAWRQITEDDLRLKLTDAELSAVGDVLYEGITSVTDMVRGHIATAGVEMDADATTLPERLIGHACAVLAVDLYIRLGGTLVDPKGHRKDAKDAAVRIFERVADGKYSIDDSITGSEASSGGATVVNRRPPRVSRDSLRGY